MSFSNENMSPLIGTLNEKRDKPKTIEQRYQKKNPIEHILLRPESYIGSVQKETQTVWIWSESQQRMINKSIEYVPGLYKIFDEILVNAADVKARETANTPKSQRLTSIKVELNKNFISVYNDGEGIPVEIHKEHKIYVPELIFGHLLTSDNYDDSEARVTGGRNGYGAKLTNIFSTEFSVECVDSIRKRKLIKKWKKNMSESDQAVVKACSDSKSSVKVTFKPDLKRFQLTEMSEDFLALLHKRVYDVAGCCNVKVTLNGKVVPVDNFKNYVDLYFKSDPSEIPSTPLKIYEKSGRWEVIISISDGQFQQVSFVNSICTLKGGSHVNYVCEPLIQAILKKVNSKNKGGIEVKSHQIRSHLFVFLNCQVVNPTFDSQTKETLTLKASQFGSKFVLSDKTINAVIKSEILENILLWAKNKQQIELQKKLKGTSGRSNDRVTGIPKLEDANEAGSNKSGQCTLILTEGESAKTSCVAGLSVVGRDLYGVFPLRGKLLNVREASFKQQVENQEIQAILKIMGLQVGKVFESPKGLRYGSLMIMTDQDLDGSHIKGLLINMIAHYWPHLLKYQGFLKEFVTPLVKVTKDNKSLSFFTLSEYESWRHQHLNEKGWKIKYYKGLGTSTDKEFKEYFTNLDDHRLEFVYSGNQDMDAIDMAFSGKRAEDRKSWIQAYQETDYIDYSKKTITYSEFINKELVVFSKYDTFRSIPNCMDGLKPVQRKVLYAAFKRNLREEIKVAQFTGYISEKTAYHHGEQSLGATIIGMAQNFTGSNNITLLTPCGQFGSRKEGGKDASAIRYIFTKLSPFARALFPADDDPLLSYLNDDGFMIEPKYYIPVIPLVLINGSEGIGTGWSSFVPNYNPRDVINNIRRYIKGEPMEPMTPWYKGFKGSIVARPGGFESSGIIKKIDHETLVVTELPIRLWTQSFKQFLEDCMFDKVDSADRKKYAFGSQASIYIDDYRDNSTHEHVHFTIKMSPTQMDKAESEGLLKAFKLKKTLGTSNMTLFDPNLKVQRYVTELDIIREFAKIRAEYYHLRKQYLTEKLQRECKIFTNKVRFIKSIISGAFTVSNKKRDVLLKELQALKYQSLSEIYNESQLIRKLEADVKKFVDFDSSDQPADTIVETSAAKDFEYLLGMTLWNLTEEKVVELQNKTQSQLEAYEKLIKLTPYDLWEADLQNLERVLDEQEKQEIQEESELDIDFSFSTEKSTTKKSKTPKKMTDLGYGTSKVKKPVSKPRARNKTSKKDSSKSNESKETTAPTEDETPISSYEKMIKAKFENASETMKPKKKRNARTKKSRSKPQSSTVTPKSSNKATKRLRRVSDDSDSESFNLDELSNELFDSE